MKAKLWSVALLLMMAALALAASAGTVTLVHPATSDRFETSAIGGLIILNASADFNATWCAFYGSSASTANSSATIVIRNVTHDFDFTNNSVNSSINSRLFEDSNDYTWSAMCANITSATTYTSASTTGVILDNSVPDVPTPNTASGFTDDDGSLNLNATVLENQTTGCTLRFLGTVPIGVGASISITSGSSLCTRVVSGPVGNGVFRYTFTANDGTNTTAESAARDLIVTLDGNRKKSILVPVEVAADLGVGQKSKLSGTPLLILLGAGALIAWSMFKKK